MLFSGKSPGADSIPPEIYKEDGNQLVRRLLRLFLKIWDNKAISQDFKEVLIVHIFKGKVIRHAVMIIEGYHYTPLPYSTGYLLYSRSPP